MNQIQVLELLKLLSEQAPAIMAAGGHFDMDVIQTIAKENGVPQLLVDELQRVTMERLPA